MTGDTQTAAFFVLLVFYISTRTRKEIRDDTEARHRVTALSLMAGVQTLDWGMMGVQTVSSSLLKWQEKKSRSSPMWLVVTVKPQTLYKSLHVPGLPRQDVTSVQNSRVCILQQNQILQKGKRAHFMSNSQAQNLTLGNSPQWKQTMC